MTALKSKAFEIAYDLYNRDVLSSSDYEAINESLGEIESLHDRDRELEELWAELTDVPMDPDTERLEEPFMDFPAGTDRETIWHWFDERYSQGVAHLLYGDGNDRTDQIARLVYLKQLCFDCESTDCQFNHDGQCRFALVHEAKPSISDERGCLSYEYRATDL